MRTPSLLLIAATLILPAAVANTSICPGPLACAQTTSESNGEEGHYCEDGYEFRRISLEAGEGDVRAKAYLENLCGGGYNEDGSSYHYRHVGHGATIWLPMIGGWGVGGQWRSSDEVSQDGHEEHVCRFQYGVPAFAVDEPCPAGQRPPMLLPPLP